MAMRFSYRQVSISHQAVTLGGQQHRPRPIVGLTIIGPGGTIFRRALFDTGADEIILSERFAPLLGINLDQAPTNTSAGVGSPTFLVCYAQVQLRLTDGVEYREWSATIGFTSAEIDHVLFGFAQGLQYFTATFHGDREEVELEVNGLYHGS